MARKTISQRIALIGGDEVKKQLAAMGQKGEEAFKDIQGAAEKLKGPGAEFARNMDKALARIRGMGEQFDRVGRKMRNWGAGLSVGVTAPLLLLARQSIDAWNQQADSIAQVEAALVSTAGVSKQTSEGLQEMASQFQEITTYGDEAILSMQAVLLTFTNIRGDRFKGATQAILNMSAALGKDLMSSALQVGKAMNDPVLGVSALAEAGIQFTLQQKEQIKAMVEVGDVAGAQALILKELEVQFGGVAEAMAKTPAGQWAQAMNALGDALEHVGASISPHVLQLAAFVKDLAIAFQALPPGVKDTIVILGAVAAVLGPLLASIGLMVMGLGGLATGFAAVMGLVPVLGAAFAGLLAATGPLLPILATIGAALVSLPAAIIALGVALGVLVGVSIARWDEIKALAVDAMDAIGAAVQAVVGDLVGWFEDAYDRIERGLRRMVAFATAQIERIARGLSKIGSALGFSGGGEAGFAGGGRVRGPGTSTSDSILARLSNGEYVVRARAVQHYGPRLFQMLNNMMLPRIGAAQGGLIAAVRGIPTALQGFASGGLAGASLAGLEQGAAAAGPYATLNLSIGGQTFTDLMAPRETAERLIKFALSEDVRSAGRRPNWYRND